MNENGTIKDLEMQARNTKYLMDALSTAYLGMTTEEILRLALGSGGAGNDKDDDDSGGG